MNQLIPKTKRVVLGGRVAMLYSLGWLALISGKAPTTLRRYERERILPKPLIRLTGMRFYLADELREYGYILKQANLISGKRIDLMPTSLPELRRELAAANERVRTILASRQLKDLRRELPESRHLENVALSKVSNKINERLTSIENAHQTNNSNSAGLPPINQD